MLICKNISWYIAIWALLVVSTSTCAGEETTSSGYTKELVDLVEMLYGDGFLEMGGEESIDEMFKEISLEDKQILDIGSGLGGVDTYLAEKYAVTIIGVDPEEALVERATKRAETLKACLKGSVIFKPIANGVSLSEYPNEMFDIVMSRGAILHVPVADKKLYFSEMLRVLKPGGVLVIDDWMHTSPRYAPDVVEMMQADGIHYHLTTPEEYSAMLSDVEFSSVKIRDTTDESYNRSVDICGRVRESKNQIEEQFGTDTYGYALKSWSTQADAFKRRELLTGIVTAYKTKG